MRTALFVVLFLLCLAAVPSSAHAQEVTRMPEHAQHAIGVDAGLGAGFVARATYSHRLDLGFDHSARLLARFTLPFAAPDLGDFALDGGVQAAVLRSRDLRLAALVGPVARKADNRVFSAVAVGVAATLLVGYEGLRWGLSGEIGYEQLLATHIDHSDLYRGTFYAGAKDGWYAASGSTAHAGVRGGARIGAFEIFARAGLAATGQLHAIDPPFYGMLGTAYAF